MSLVPRLLNLRGWRDGHTKTWGSWNAGLRISREGGSPGQGQWCVQQQERLIRQGEKCRQRQQGIKSQSLRNAHRHPEDKAQGKEKSVQR